MPDYNFAGLSARSFEHFVQSIASTVIGPSLLPFGDGPDGGREAIFDGHTSYGGKGTHWTGYGVIQAKFLQRPVSSKSDGDWAIKQLRDELAKYSGETPRRVPEYYIFATNAVLTPAADTGSKDKALLALSEFASTYSLKGFDLWDYDKLRMFTDANEGVRKSFAGWISSGDVLEDLAEWVRILHPDLTKILLRAIQKELLADTYARLEQAGHSPNEKIPLSQVFVDLPISDKPNDEAAEHPEYFIQEVLKAAPDSFRSERRNDDSPWIPGRYVLIGGPGQVKTTLGQFVCQLFRAAYLDRADPKTISHETKDTLSSFIDGCANENIPLPSVRRFPIRVVLSELASDLSDGKCSSLLDFITRSINRLTSSSLDGEQIMSLLKLLPCVIVYDGLDEVPASSNRAETLDAITEFGVDLAAAGVDAMIVATSRPQGYNTEFSPRAYRHLFLTPLPKEDAVRYADRLIDVRFGTDPNRSERIKSRIRRAAGEAATARLMRSPLQVTIMTLLVDRSGQPPQERWSLFNQYYNVIYQRELERDIPAAAVLQDYHPDIEAIHRTVGLLLQIESERAGGSEARLSTAQFSAVVEARLAAEGHVGSERTKLASAIIDAAAQRLVFLVGLESGQVGFEIRSLQEYMAAEALMDASDELKRRRLKTIAPSPNWRNVFLFAAGKCAVKHQYLRDTIFAICSELNVEPGNPLLRVTRAGSELALNLLEDGSAREQPNHNAALSRLALNAAPDHTESLARRIVDVYRDSAQHAYVEAFQDHLTRAPSAESSLALGCLTDMVESSLGGDSFERLLRAQIDRGVLKDEESFHAIWDHCSGRSWVTPTTVRAAPRHGLTGFTSSLSTRDKDATIEGTGTDSLKWLSDLASLTRQRSKMRTRVPIWDSCGLNEEPTLIGYMRLGSLTEMSKYWRPSLARIPNANKGWILLKKVTAFCQAPSRHTLREVLEDSVTELERLAGGNVRFSPFHLYEYRAPWPVAAALSLSRTPDDARELASLASEGTLGDIEEWRQQETDWRIDGILLDTLAAKGRTDGWPGGLHNALLPTADYFEPADPAKELRGLVTIHDHCGTTIARRAVVTWLEQALVSRQGIVRGNHHSPADREPLNRDVLRMLIQSNDFADFTNSHLVPLVTSELVDSSVISATEAAEVLAGCESAKTSGFIRVALREPIWAAAAEAYLAGSIGDEVLPILASGRPSLAMAQRFVPALAARAEERGPFTDPSVNVAALLLQLTSEGENLEERCRAVAAMSISDPEPAMVVFSYIRSAMATDPIAERHAAALVSALALEMLESSDEGTWKGAANTWVLSFARRLISSSPTELTNPSSWQSLGLDSDMLRATLG